MSLVDRSQLARLLAIAMTFGSVLSVQAVAAAPASVVPAAHFELVTLGTGGGPMPNPNRSQPANLLSNGAESYLIDCGDGAAERMVAAGAGFPSLRGIFITHHHFDHIGGLFAVLGLRFQLETQGELTIYGPPGIKAIVTALLAAMEPSAEARYGVPGENYVSPAQNIEVIEMTDNSKVKVGSITVSAVVNSHYDFRPGGPEYAKYQSLAYRFDLPDRAIVFTGDTGPSAAVEKLATNADLLVSEMIDLPNTLAMVTAFAKNMPPHIRAQIVEHLETQHLVPVEIGKLARHSKVGAVIVSHLVGVQESESVSYVSEIAKGYNGPIIIAKDMQRF